MINNAMKRLGIETAGHYLRKLDQRLLPVVVIACSLIVYDLFSRLLVVQEDFSVQTERQQLNLTPVPTLDDETFAIYLKELSQYQSKPTGSESADAQTAAMEPIDRAGYSQLGDFSYRLVAVFKHEKTVALLSKLSNGGDVAELIEVQVEDFIGGYQITSIESQVIALSSAVGDQVRLKLFERAVSNDNE